MSLISCEDRDAIKALTAAEGALAYLCEADREGLFVFQMDDDYATRVATDTEGGIYLEASNIAASSGAWVRQLPEYGTWQVGWFGVLGDDSSGGGSVLCDAEMTAMVNLANLVKPTRILFGSHIYSLGAAIPEWSFQVELIGARGAQGTIINKRYVETHNYRGIFAFNDHGFTIDKITFKATSGTGGSAISAILTRSNQPADGRTYLIDTYVSVGTNCRQSLYVNGMSNTNSGGPGYRGLWIRGGEFFGAAMSSVHIEGAHHVFMTGVFIAAVGGETTSKALLTGGSATVYNDDWQFKGVISGPTELHWFGGGTNPNPGGPLLGGRSKFDCPQIGTITVDANAQDVMWDGPRVTGTVSNLAGSGFTCSWDGTIVLKGGNSSAGYRVWGDGRIEQWGTATTSSGVVTAQPLPLAFTSSNINYSAQPVAFPASNTLTLVSVIKNAGAPLTQYDARAGNWNYSSGATGAASAAIRWTATGQ